MPENNYFFVDGSSLITDVIAIKKSEKELESKKLDIVKFSKMFIGENKSEKAVDTQICCDALQLASYGRLDRLFIYTNDYDFVPLCQTLKSMGSNISLFRLQEKKINKNLVQECDSFSVVPVDQLSSLFA